MPRVEDILARLGKAKYFTTLDLRSGYHHIALDKQSIKKTPFCTPFGKYKYLKVPFGLAQTPSYFQKLMNKVFNGLNFAFVLCIYQTLNHINRNALWIDLNTGDIDRNAVLMSTASLI